MNEIKKIWIDEDGTTTLFDEAYQKIMADEDHPQAKNIFATFKPHLIIPMDQIDEFLKSEPLKKGQFYCSGWNACLQYFEDWLRNVGAIDE